MKILVIEDRGSASYYLLEALTQLNHDYYEADDISAAQHYWDDRANNSIDMIIVDLNLPPEGLTESQLQEMKEKDIFAGWIWIRDVVLKDNPDMKPKIIIYTAYEDILKRKVDSNQLEGFRIVAKSANTGKEISRHLLEIEAKL